MNRNNDWINPADDSDFDPAAPIFGDDFEPITTPVKGYEPPAASPETLEIVRDFETQIEEIHLGNFPAWDRFFEQARKLENEYFGDYGQSTALSDELMSVYELVDVEALYTDTKFLVEIVKILPEDVHFACFLLNSTHQHQISAKVLSEMLKTLISSTSPMDCDGCSGNRWWGNPIAYLAVNPNTNPQDLIKIFEISVAEKYEFYKDITMCALAQNPSTPTEVLKQLAHYDRKSLGAEDDQCPFFDPNNKSSSNIGYWAKRRLAERQA